MIMAEESAPAAAAAAEEEESSPSTYQSVELKDIRDLPDAIQVVKYTDEKFPFCEWWRSVLVTPAGLH